MPDQDAVRTAHHKLFAGVLDGASPADWYMELTERIEIAEAALVEARRQRAMICAHLRDSLGWTYSEIAAATKGAISPQRAGQLAARGRPHITPVKPEQYQREEA